MSAIACGARSKRESRSASGSVENWVSFAGLTARSRASSMHCVASGRRWPRPSAASWTCWGSSSDRWPTSRTASRRSSPSPPVRRGGTSRSRRLATDDARRQVEPEGSSPSPNRADGVSSVHKLAGRASVPYDAGMERTTTRRPRRGGGAKASPAGVAPARTELTVAPAVEIELLVPGEPPEPSFAARVPPPAPERRRPTTRHAIFVAVGNWRVIGHETARLLARHGAQLVHSAPSTGVRDWSDLRIAVSAGVWLAGARPGDVLEIVSDDRAFDAVGDVAAALGITFHRLTARTLGGVSPAEPSHAAPATERGQRRGSRGRRGGRAPAAGAEARRAEAGRQEPERDQPVEAHTAPHDELVLVVRELAERTPNGAVLIDNVARTLKARGFSRPAGSPRLVTRLRRIKELSVSPTGMITLAPGALHVEPAPPALVDAPSEAVAAPKRARRRSRRGGRRRRRTTPAAGA